MKFKFIFFVPIFFIGFVITSCSYTPNTYETVELEKIISINAGNAASFIIDENNLLWGWGSNRSFLLNNTIRGYRFYPETKPIIIFDDVIYVSANGNQFPSRISGYVLAIRSDNTLWGWGEVPLPRISLTPFELDEFFLPPLARIVEPLQIFEDVKYVSAGADHIALITIDGMVWSWSSSFVNTLQYDVNVDEVEIIPFLENIIHVSAGHRNTFAIKNDYTLWAWGNNDQGQIGNGTTDFVPEPIIIMDDVIKVSAGIDFTMAIKSDFSLWAWGNNEFGQLGHNGLSYVLTPIKIKDNVIYVATGTGYTMAIDSNSTLWAWGSNTLGQLGDGTNDDRFYPVAIMDNVKDVSVGGFRGNEYTLALRNDGTLWAWGANTFSQLGDGTTEYQNRPLQITHTTYR